MEEYISRERALNFDMSIDCDPGDLEKIMEGMARYTEYLKRVPAADVREVEKGKWIWTETGRADYEQFWVCSECGDHTFIESNFCPKCGADMRPEPKEE